MAEFSAVMSDAPATSIGVLASGGLDSAILLSHLADRGRRVRPFYVDSGLHWQREELAALRAYLAADADLAAGEHHERLGSIEPLVELDLQLGDLYGPHWSCTGRGAPGADTPDEAVYLPGRNLLLTIKPALWCQMNGIAELAIGLLASNPFDDASDAFFTAWERAIAHDGQPPLRLVRPLGHLSKQQVMQLGRRYPLGETFSCISPVVGLHCGHCNKCAERRAAFRLIKLDDPTCYANNP